MAIYKPSLLDKFKDFVNGLRSNWDEYEDHVTDFEAHLAESVSQEGGVHGIIMESGTWTPELTFNYATTGITYKTQEGKYTRLGDIVTVSLKLELTSKGTATGNARIAGLPFPASNSIGVGTPFIRNVLLDDAIKIVLATEVSSLGLRTMTGDGTVPGILNHNHFTNDTFISYEFTYRIGG